LSATTSQSNGPLGRVVSAALLPAPRTDIRARVTRTANERSKWFQPAMRDILEEFDTEPPSLSDHVLKKGGFGLRRRGRIGADVKLTISNYVPRPRRKRQSPSRKSITLARTS
jgi:hypothetical protein